MFSVCEWPARVGWSIKTYKLRLGERHGTSLDAGLPELEGDLPRSFVHHGCPASGQSMRGTSKNAYIESPSRVKHRLGGYLHVTYVAAAVLLSPKLPFFATSIIWISNGIQLVPEYSLSII